MKNLKYTVRNKVYFDIGDYINEVRFKVMIPSYAVGISEVVEKKYFIPSFISNMEKTSMSLSMITIADMIDFVNKSIFVKILKNEDILSIYETMVEYINNLKKLDNLSDRAEKYLKKSIFFKDSLEKTLNRLSNIDPYIKKNFKDNKSVEDILNDYA